MESRHQLFVIARVGNYYRSLAAVNHHSLTGMRALAQCNRLLQIFSHPSNRVPLEQELSFAEEHFSGKPPPRSEQPESYFNRPSPFSFITTCLSVGSFYRTDGHPAVAIHQTPFGLGFDGCDNGGGITVIDITDLNKVKYCYVFFLKPCESEELKNPSRVGLYYRPLTAWQYILTYWKKDDKFLQEQRCITLTTELERRPVVEVTSLAETWPWGKWDLGPLESQPNPQNRKPIAGPRGLVELTVDKMMRAVKKSSNTVDLDTIKREISNFPGLQKLLKDWFVQNADLVDNSPATISLLTLAYGGERVLNWARFRSLDIPSIRDILSKPEFQTVHTVNLSATPASFSPKKLWTVLSLLPNLKNVYFLDPLSASGFITCDSFVELAEANLANRLDKLVMTSPFYHSLRKQAWIVDESCPPLRTPSFPVAQLLVHHDKAKIPDLARYEYFFLGDGLLSPVRLVTGLFQYMNILHFLVYSSAGSTALEASASFAASSSFLTSTDFGEIGPLPAQIYKYGHDGHMKISHRGCYSAMRDLQPGQWTVLLSHVRSSTFRYAFVKAKEMIRVKASNGSGKVSIDPAKIDIFTIEDFLRETAPEVDVSGVQNLYSQIPPKSVESNTSVLRCLDKHEVWTLLDKFIEHTKRVELRKEHTRDF